MEFIITGLLVPINIILTFIDGHTSLKKAVVIYHLSIFNEHCSDSYQLTVNQNKYFKIEIFVKNNILVRNRNYFSSIGYMGTRGIFYNKWPRMLRQGLFFVICIFPDSF